MTPELLKLITRQAEEKYPDPVHIVCKKCGKPYCDNYVKHGSCGEIPDYQNLIDNKATVAVLLNREHFINSTQKQFREAHISAATAWAEKIEAIRAVTIDRISRAQQIIDSKREGQENPFDGMNYENLFGLKRAYGEILSLIDKHLKQ